MSTEAVHSQLSGKPNKLIPNTVLLSPDAVEFTHEGASLLRIGSLWLFKIEQYSDLQFLPVLSVPHYRIQFTSILLKTGIDPVQSYDVTLADGESGDPFCEEQKGPGFVLLVPKYSIHMSKTANIPNIRKLKGCSGVATLLSGFVMTLPKAMHDLSLHQHRQLELSVVSMVQAAFFPSNNRNQKVCRVTTLARIKKCIENRLTQSDLSPECIADEMGLSRRYLHQLFSDAGETFQTYVQKRRIEQISAEFRAPDFDLSITECALNWGFNDVSHFSRVFKRWYGCTAREYIRQSRC